MKTYEKVKVVKSIVEKYVNENNHIINTRTSSKWQVVFRLLPAAFLLLISFVIHAQNPQITVSKFAFSLLNKKDNSFIVIDDSAYYWSIKVSDKVWKKNNYVFKSNELSFGDFLSYYRPVS